jgi:prepilin-type N-terminal cleavage/methylation domain-containing protein
MIGRLRRRLAESGGYTLSELIVVLAILLIVVAALAQLFSSASNAQNDMSNRFQAQQDARLALDKLRQEIHCASAVTNTPAPPPWPPTVWPPPWPTPTTPTSSITIALGSYCPTNTTGAAAEFTWCTKDKTGGTPPGAGAPYTLWRYGGNSCSGTGQPWANNLTTGTVFTTYTAPSGGNLGTLSVDLPVDLTPSDTKQRYDLKDDIVLRNTPRS